MRCGVELARPSLSVSVIRAGDPFSAYVLPQRVMDERPLNIHPGPIIPSAPPLRLGDPSLDTLSLREPDLALYDELVPTPMTRDPGPSPTTTADQEPAPDDQEAH